MYKKLLLLFILTIPASAFAQRYSNYFTGTMFDSFENPSQSVFKIDTTKNMAFNFFVPNFTTNAFLTGDAVRTVKDYMFYSKSTNPNLIIGKGKINNANIDVNVYIAMFKLFTSLSGREEIGASWQIKTEGNARFTDESIGLFNGATNFTSTSFNNLFNNNYYAQAYHQFSFTYRETLDKHYSLGLKLSALSGIGYNSGNVNSSYVTLNQNITGTTTAIDYLVTGRYRSTFSTNSHPTRRDVIPNFRNPGASLSLSLEQHNDDGVYLMYNIKDLGFIHWNQFSRINNFNASGTVLNINTSKAGQNLTRAAKDVLLNGQINSSFTTVTNGRAEISGTKYFWLDDTKSFKYNPVFVVSKQLFYRGATGVIINNLNYKNYTIGITTSYDDLNQFNLGGQFMIKSKKAEFYIGCEQLLGALELGSANNGNLAAINRNSQHLSGGLFMGFALKFGQEIQSHANADHIPMGYDEDGFIKRTFKSIFFKDKPVSHD